MIFSSLPFFQRKEVLALSVGYGLETASPSVEERDWRRVVRP